MSPVFAIGSQEYASVAKRASRATDQPRIGSVTDETEFQPIIERLLNKPDVTTAHVRTLAPQCFLYAVAAD